MEGDHVGLDGDVGVLPGVEGADGHVAIFRGRRDEVELLALEVALGALLGEILGGEGCGRGVLMTAGEEENEEESGEKCAGFHQDRIARQGAVEAAKVGGFE